MSNAVLERTFHDGRCHYQASYALFELAKNKIFNASLVCSRTEDLATEHWYLTILDDYSVKALSGHKPMFAKIEPGRFNPTTPFFDTWSNQLCLWSQFKPDKNYTRSIPKIDQALFKSLTQTFDKEEKIIEYYNLVFNRI